MAGLSSVATGHGGKPIYGGTPFGSLQSILGAQSLNPPRPGPTPAPTGATTEAQNQWLAPGNMPIDEGAVAYQRQLEAGKIQADQATAAATQANEFKTAGTQQEFDLGQKGAGAAFDLGQKGADANQNRLFGALDKLGIDSLTSQTSGGGGGAAPVPAVGGGDAGWGAANAAATGRAKDTSAAAVGAAERAMKNNMGARGIAGSGIEAKQDMGIQLAGAGELGAAGRQVAEGTAARAGAVADRNYTGEITQRGQDISAADSAASRKNAMLQSLMSLFKVSASY